MSDPIQDFADELRDAVGDHYDNGKAADPCVLWHEAGMPDAIDWRGVATTLLAYFTITRRGSADE